MKTTLRRLAKVAAASLAVLLSPPSALCAPTPKTLTELWADFDEQDRSTPLDIEILKQWEQDEIVCRIIRYNIGVFKGATSKVAAFYAFPKSAGKLPAILDLHGGGQSASLSTVVTYAKRGYTALSLNWGGNKMSLGQENWTGPQTDWGNVDATHPPQRNTSNHFVENLKPDDLTLDHVESPRNSNWFLVLTAARRAVSLLQKQSEVDPSRIGVRGHSMGGKLTTDLAGIDQRIKAAVPSCGGSGDLIESEDIVPGGSRAKRSPVELACISDNAYLPRISCPILWLSPTNDFHAHIDNMAWNWKDLPDDRTRFSISPHLNHHHTDEHAITEYLWFEENLKGAPFKLPKTPLIQLELNTQNGIPQVKVTPDPSHPPQRVDIYYSTDPHALTRFWRDAKATKSGPSWIASCPIMSTDQPIFTFANVIYETPTPALNISQQAGRTNSPTFAISSRVKSASQSHLKAAGVKPSDQPDRNIDDGSRGWHDWFRLNWGHPPLWTATTRKLKDPKWRGPDDATLNFEIRCESDNQLVITFNCNAWGAMTPGKPPVDYCVVKPLKASPDWQPISIALNELISPDPKNTTPLTDWQTVTELTISPTGSFKVDGQKSTVTGKPWKGPREIRNLRWEGGKYTERTPASSTIRSEDFQRNFNDAIKRSIEQEKKGQK